MTYDLFCACKALREMFYFAAVSAAKIILEVSTACPWLADWDCDGLCLCRQPCKFRCRLASAVAKNCASPYGAAWLDTVRVKAADVAHSKAYKDVWLSAGHGVSSIR